MLSHFETWNYRIPSNDFFNDLPTTFSTTFPTTFSTTFLDDSTESRKQNLVGSQCLRRNHPPPVVKLRPFIARVTRAHDETLLAQGVVSRSQTLCHFYPLRGGKESVWEHFLTTSGSVFHRQLVEEISGGNRSQSGMNIITSKWLLTFSESTILIESEE